MAIYIYVDLHCFEKIRRECLADFFVFVVTDNNISYFCNNSTIQQFNNSTIQRLNNQQLNNTTW